MSEPARPNGYVLKTAVGAMIAVIGTGGYFWVDAMYAAQADLRRSAESTAHRVTRLEAQFDSLESKIDDIKADVKRLLERK